MTGELFCTEIQWGFISTLNGVSLRLWEEPRSWLPNITIGNLRLKWESMFFFLPLGSSESSSFLSSSFSIPGTSLEGPQSWPKLELNQTKSRNRVIYCDIFSFTQHKKDLFCNAWTEALGTIWNGFWFLFKSVNKYHTENWAWILFILSLALWGIVVSFFNSAVTKILLSHQSRLSNTEGSSGRRGQGKSHH